MFAMFCMNKNDTDDNPCRYFSTSARCNAKNKGSRHNHDHRPFFYSYALFNFHGNTNKSKQNNLTQSHRSQERKRVQTFLPQGRCLLLLVQFTSRDAPVAVSSTSLLGDRSGIREAVPTSIMFYWHTKRQ